MAKSYNHSGNVSLNATVRASIVKVNSKPCKICGDDHPAFVCPKRKRKAMRKEAVKTKAKRLSTRKLWFELNRSDSSGFWYCYLNISPQCLKRLTEATIVLEHEQAKVRRPDLKYDVKNIKPSCSPCNELKGSLSAEEAMLKYKKS